MMRLSVKFSKALCMLVYQTGKQRGLHQHTAKYRHSMKPEVNNAIVLHLFDFIIIPENP